MKKPIFLLLFIALLVGAGCTAPIEPTPATGGPPPFPIEGSLVEFEEMTPEELAAAMEAEMKVNPPKFASDAEMKKEGEKALAMMAEVTVKTGSFGPKVHQGQGKATIVKKDGKTFLVLDEAFKTDAGPRLHIYLSGHASPSTSAELHSAGEVDLGALKAASGAQVYEIPAAEANTDWKSVVVYCVPFKVVFTVATLQ